MVIEAAKWSKDNINVLFRYALEYISETKVIPTPKFHMVDQSGRVVIISCDFWNDNKDYTSLKQTLDKLAEAFGAVSSLLVISGKTDGNDAIGIITYSDTHPRIHIKQIIQHKSIVDFGPAVIVPVSKICDFM